MSKPPAPIVIDKPGFYQIPAWRYHEDPCPAPSLSSSIAHEMLRHSPAHARHAHPRLNPFFQRREPTSQMVDGTVLHWLMFDAGPEPLVVDADSFRSAAARKYQEQAAAEHRPCILWSRYQKLRRVAAATRKQLRAFFDVPEAIADGFAECTLVWREGDIWCRAMLDWQVPRPGLPIVDLKFTSKAAAAEPFARAVADNGYDIQWAWYRRGFRAVHGFDAADLVFVTVETDPPYGVSVNGLGFGFQEIGEQKVERAIELWSQCMKTGRWPGYPRRVGYVDAPAYASIQWQDQDARQVQQMRDAMRRPRRVEGPDVPRLIVEQGFG